MKIATWNVNSLSVRLPHVLTWLETSQPDVLCLQEIKLIDEKFPIDAIRAAGYHAVCCGQRTYNGVAIFSREPIEEVVSALPEFNDDQKRVVAVTVSGVRIICVYVPNGQSLESEKYRYKLSWLASLRSWIKQELIKYPRLAVLGDFNVAPEDQDVHDPALWEGGIHVSPAERLALREIMELGLKDSFRLFDQPPGLFSWWDYRMAAFRRNLGLRIDLILLSQALANHCVSCVIDKVPRKWDRPSDHAPVIAEINLPSS